MASCIDTLIIGSGFGGAVVAARLVEAGQKVTLLERGAWRETAALKDYPLTQRAPLPHGKYFASHLLREVSVGGRLAQRKVLNTNGLFDIHYDKGMTSICSSGVGGGSHVYLAMNTRPLLANYWDNRANGLSADNMETHYQWILSRMGSRPAQESDNIVNLVPQRLGHHPALDTEIEQPALGFRFGHAYANNAFLGDANGHKVTLDSLLLAPVLNKGLTVYAQHECLTIHQQQTGYRVEVFDHSEQKYRFLLAKRVVIAAGTLNSLRLLFRSQALGGLAHMPALGKGFSGNGDVFALWQAGTKDDDFRTGTPTLGRFKLRGLPDSPMLYALGINGIDQIPLLPTFLRRSAKSWLALVGMGNDEANGRVTWRNDELHIDYQQAKNPILAHIYHAFDLLSQHDKKRVWFLPQRAITVHPLGGARVGNHQQDSVVNAKGQVHGHRHLYVSDGSALPAATGTPPSMTIAAWASHVSQHILSEMKNHETDI